MNEIEFLSQDDNRVKLLQQIKHVFNERGIKCDINEYIGDLFIDFLPSAIYIHSDCEVSFIIKDDKTYETIFSEYYNINDYVSITTLTYIMFEKYNRILNFMYETNESFNIINDRKVKYKISDETFNDIIKNKLSK